MWSYGNIRIYAQTDVDATSQIIPRIQPLSGPTILQIFGNDSAIKSITAIVVGSGDASSLNSYAADGTAYTLVSPEVTVGSFYLKSISMARQYSISQTMRPDLACDAEVYMATMELYGA